MITCEGSNCYRNVWRPRCRCADLRHGTSGQLGKNRKPIHVRCSPLIGPHPQRRIPLQMLRTSKPFADGEANILDGHIVLKVDECLTFGSRHVPKRGTCYELPVGPYFLPGRRSVTCGFGSINASSSALTQCIGQREGAARRSNNCHSSRLLCRQKRGATSFPVRTSTQM